MKTLSKKTQKQNKQQKTKNLSQEFWARDSLPLLSDTSCVGVFYRRVKYPEINGTKTAHVKVPQFRLYFSLSYPVESSMYQWTVYWLNNARPSPLEKCLFWPLRPLQILHLRTALVVTII